MTCMICKSNKIKNHVKMPTIKEINDVSNHYHILSIAIFFYSYVATDVLLLADVLEKYRKICWNRMGLEALCYISLPSLTFDACLKTTKTKLQIVKDIDLLQMLETGIRGLAFNFTII